jgi:hypothetical protein
LDRLLLYAARIIDSWFFCDVRVEEGVELGRERPLLVLLQRIRNTRAICVQDR